MTNRRVYGSGGAGGGTAPVIASSVFNVDPANPYRANMPAVVNANDLLLMLIILGGSAGSSVSSAPAGWTPLIVGNFAGLYKWAAGTEGGTTVTVNMSGSGIRAHFCVLRLTGADTSQAPQAVVTFGAGSTTPDPPSIDPTWADWPSLIIAWAGGSSSSIALVSYPAGYGLYNQANVVAEACSYVAAKEVLVATPEDPGIFTLASAPTAVRTFTIAVKGSPP